MEQWLKNSIAFFAVTIASGAFAHTPTAYAATQSIIEGWFAAMKDKKFDTASSFLAPEFVSVHTDGIVRDKKGEMELIKKLKLQSYKLTDFEFVQSTDIITVTYKAQVSEKIDDKAMATTPATRMAVMQKQGDKWLIVAYANLDAIK